MTGRVTPGSKGIQIQWDPDDFKSDLMGKKILEKLPELTQTASSLTNHTTPLSETELDTPPTDPNTPVKSLVQTAFDLYNEGAFALAKTAIQERLKQETKDPNLLAKLHYLLASIYDKQSKPQKALKAIQRGLAVSPDAPMLSSLYFSQTIVCLQLGELKKAQEAAEAGLKQNPEPDVCAWFNCVVISQFIKENKLNNALQTVEAGLFAKSTDPNLCSLLQLQRAIVYNKLSNFKMARTASKIGLEQKLIDPSLYAKLSLQLSIAYTTLGKYEKTLKVIKKTELPGSERGLCANLHLQSAIAYNYEKMFNNAWAAAQLGLNYNSTDPNLYLQQAIARSHQGKGHEKAVQEAAELGLSQNPTDPNVCAHLHLLQATASYNKKDISFFSFYRFEFLKKPDREEAQKAIEKGIAVKPTDSNLLARLYYLSARIFNDQRQYGKAEEVAGKGLKADPTVSDLNTRLYHLLAIALNNQGKSKAIEAENAARKGLEANPTANLGAELYLQLVMALDKQGKSKEAREAVQAALDLSPSNPDLLMALQSRLSN